MRVKRRRSGRGTGGRGVAGHAGGVRGARAFAGALLLGVAWLGGGGAAVAGGGAIEAGPTGLGPSAAVTPAPLQALSWVLGGWKGPQSWESWAAAGDVYWGLSLPEGGGWEVMRLDVKDGVVRFLAQPGGREPAAFVLRGAPNRRRALFTRPGDDFPTRIRYEVVPTGMAAAIGDARDWWARFDWQPEAPAGVAALAARDRAWEAEVAAGGSAAWVAGFDAEGFMQVPGVGKVTAGPAMRELMAPDLDSGVSVRWTPTAGSLGPGGELGYTVGEATWTRGEAVMWRGSYLTVWKRQPDGGWRALFDAGDVIGQ